MDYSWSLVHAPDGDGHVFHRSETLNLFFARCLLGLIARVKNFEGALAVLITPLASALNKLAYEFTSITDLEPHPLR